MTAPECTQPVIETLRLLQASSCFSAGDVCASLPCACAETLAALRAPAEGRAEEALHEIAKEVFTDGTPTKAARIALAALAVSRPHGETL